MLSYHRDLPTEILEKSAVVRGLAALDRRVVCVVRDRKKAVGGSHHMIIRVKNDFSYVNPSLWK